MVPHEVCPAGRLGHFRWWLWAQGVKEDMIRPEAGTGQCPSDHLPSVKAVAEPTQIQRRRGRCHLLMGGAPSPVHCHHQLCQRLLDLPPRLQSNPLTCDVGGGGWRREWHQPCREHHRFRGRAGLPPQGSARLTPPKPRLGGGGPPHQPGTAAGESVLHTLVFAIRKFSGPSSVLKLVPMKTKSFHLQRRA